MVFMCHANNYNTNELKYIILSLIIMDAYKNGNTLIKFICQYILLVSTYLGVEWSCFYKAHISVRTISINCVNG